MASQDQVLEREIGLPKPYPPTAESIIILTPHVDRMVSGALADFSLPTHFLAGLYPLNILSLHSESFLLWGSIHYWRAVV